MEHLHVKAVKEMLPAKHEVKENKKKYKEIQTRKIKQMKAKSIKEIK